MRSCFKNQSIIKLIVKHNPYISSFCEDHFWMRICVEVFNIDKFPYTVMIHAVSKRKITSALIH